MIEEIMKKSYKQLVIYEVTDVSSLENNKIIEYKVNIKHPNMPTQYNDVPILGIGLGNLKGLYMIPQKGDFVLVGWIGDQPIVLGSVNDYFTQSPDNIPQIRINECILIGKEKGQYIFMKNNGDIWIVTPDGAKMQLNNDGSFKIITGNSYGVLGTVAGDIEIHSATVETADKGAGTVDVPLTYNTTITW